MWLGYAPLGRRWKGGLATVNQQVPRIISQKLDMDASKNILAATVQQLVESGAQPATGQLSMRPTRPGRGRRVRLLAPAHRAGSPEASGASFIALAWGRMDAEVLATLNRLQDTLSFGGVITFQTTFVAAWQPV